MIIQFDNLRLWKYMSYYLIHNRIGNHIFLSIRSKTIDLLLCLWCPNDCFNHLEMIDSFTARTTNNLVQKGWTQFFVLHSCNFNCYFVVSRGKIRLRLNHPFFYLTPKYLHKILRVMLSIIYGMRAFFVINIFSS